MSQISYLDIVQHRVNAAMEVINRHATTDKLYNSVLALVIFLGGCAFDSGEEWRDGPYHVQWIDTFDNRTLNFDIGNGGSVGRVDNTVIAVGSNSEYVVAQQQLGVNGSIVRYYIIDRQKDHAYADSREFVIGPLSEEEFEVKKTVLKLPVFTKRF